MIDVGRYLPTDEPDGDILVFLPGQEEIESVAAIITERSRKLPVELKKLQVAAARRLAAVVARALRHQRLDTCLWLSRFLSLSSSLSSSLSLSLSLSLQVCQLFASMPPEAQLLAFEPAFEGHRKVILATNIAETAVTINGVKYVIDPGLAKVGRCTCAGAAMSV
jgi:HrpA-like RNA helicase